MPLRVSLLSIAIVLLACSSGADGDTDDPPSPPRTREQLLDPETCKSCHPKHYEEWSSSMHAYASRDPVFLAMNKRGQEEAQLGEFCVQCHARMALREGKITDFAELDDIPKHLQGVTCYFCHSAVGVRGHNNGQVQLANDVVMRAALRDPDPVEPPAHGIPSKPSSFHDRLDADSATLCGSCHDIENPLGTVIEQTFSEYRQSVQATSNLGEGFMTCQGCHMKGKKNKEPAAPGFAGTGNRTVHWHHFPAVDVALTPDLPNQEILRASVENCELRTGTLSSFEVVPDYNRTSAEPFQFFVELEHSAGHNLPSGASADRRMWIEVVAYDAHDQIVFESGRIKDGELEEASDDDPQFRPFRDYLVDSAGRETHMFWEAAKIEKSELVPFAKTMDGSHTARRAFSLKQVTPPPRIELWLRLRPMGVDVLQDLVQSGHLDPAVIEAMPTFTLTHVIAIHDPKSNTYKTDNAPGFEDTQDCDTFAKLFEERR